MSVIGFLVLSLAEMMMRKSKRLSLKQQVLFCLPKGEILIVVRLVMQEEK